MLPILFRSSDVGAPVLNNAAGALISVLDACLVTGFNSVGIASISITANVATVGTTTAHGVVAGQSVTVAGAAVGEANGDKIVATVPSPTSYTFPCITGDTTESPVGASSKRTSLGWIKEFAGTNKAIYKMSNPAAYGQMLRVDDTTAGFDARVVGVESATDVDAYTDPFPTAAQQNGGGYWSRGANTAASKVWVVVGDGRFFYYLAEDSSRHGAYSITRVGYTGGYFGDSVSFKAGEAYGCIIGGAYAGTNSITAIPALKQTSLGNAPPVTDFSYICRQHTGITKSVSVAFCHPMPSSSGTVSGSTAPVYPSPVDNGTLFAEPSLIIETLLSAGHPARGILPGFVSLGCRFSDLPNVLGGDVMAATDGSGSKFIVFKGANSSQSPDSALTLKLSSAWR